MSRRIAAICGPTASGKTALGVALAEAVGGEVISCDSMQIYRRMDIGTAKPTPAETRGIPHHMIDVADPADPYSVARYVDEASRCADDILARGKLPILVGGTGLYLDSLIARSTFAPFSGRWRGVLQTRARAEGLPALYAELATIDPLRHAKLAPTDEKRILRALEVFYETGETITQHDADERARPPYYQAARFCLFPQCREEQNARINARVDVMMAQGLPREVAALLESGVPPSATAMQAIGYKELVAGLTDHHPLSDCAEEIKLRSRQYAKRQLTWFRRHPSTRFFGWSGALNLSDALQNVTSFLAESGIS